MRYKNCIQLLCSAYTYQHNTCCRAMPYSCGYATVPTTSKKPYNLAIANSGTLATARLSWKLPLCYCVNCFCTVAIWLIELTTACGFSPGRFSIAKGCLNLLYFAIAKEVVTVDHSCGYVTVSTTQQKNLQPSSSCYYYKIKYLKFSLDQCVCCLRGQPPPLASKHTADIQAPLQ